MPNSNKIIYSLRVFLKLKEMGIYPITTTSNPNKPNFLCWIYNKDQEFDKAFDRIMEDGK